MHIFYCVKLQLLVEQNPVIPNINSSAKRYITYIMSANCIYYIIYCTHIWYTYLKNMWKCNMYYRPDMG